MQVTKLIQDIGKCRDVLETKDFNEILAYIALFDDVTDRIKRQLDKYIKDEKHELDFTPYDLQELSDEIYNYIKKFQTHFTFDYGYKKLLKHPKVDDKVLADFTKVQCDEMYLDRKLRENYKILSYFGLTLYLWQENRKRG